MSFTNNFLNKIDCITLESYKDIPKNNVIILTVGNKTRFYNVRALHEWIKINQVEPETKLPFSKFQIKKIKKVYGNSNYQDIQKYIKNFINIKPFSKLNILESMPENISQLNTKNMLNNMLNSGINLKFDVEEMKEVNTEDDEILSYIQEILGSEISKGEIKSILKMSKNLMLNPEIVGEMGKIFNYTMDLKNKV